MGQRGDGFGGAESGPLAAVKGTQIALAVMQALRGHAERGGRATIDVFAVALMNFTPGNLIIGT